MKKLLLIVLLASPALAGQKYRHSDPKLNDEVDNIYHEIKNVDVDPLTISSATIESARITNLVGISNGGSPCSGCIGEVIESNSSANNSFPSTGLWGDATSIQLTPGRWLITAFLRSNANGATVAEVDLGISTTSGNSGTGLITGLNYVPINGTVSFTFNPVLVVPNYYQNISTTTTYYLKVAAFYISATPVYQYHIIAVRI